MSRQQHWRFSLRFQSIPLIVYGGSKRKLDEMGADTELRQPKRAKPLVSTSEMASELYELMWWLRHAGTATVTVTGLNNNTLTIPYGGKWDSQWEGDIAELCQIMERFEHEIDMTVTIEHEDTTITMRR